MIVVIALLEDIFEKGKTKSKDSLAYAAMPSLSQPIT
jgi:hypothetical protein